MGVISLYQVLSHKRSVLLTQIWAYKCQNGRMQMLYLAQIPYHIITTLINLAFCFFSYSFLNLAKARSGEQQLARHFRLSWETMQVVITIQIYGRTLGGVPSVTGSSSPRCDIAYTTYEGRRCSTVEAILLTGFLFYGEHVYQAQDVVPTNTKDICSYFYESLDQGRYRCKQCGNKRKQLTSTDYFNLIAHLAHKLLDLKTQYAAFLSKTNGRLQDFGFVSGETSHRFNWMRWVVERNMPLSEVDTLDVLMDIRVGMTLGICFGIMFDGWSSGSMHYVTVYGVFETNGDLHLQLLAVSPLDDGSPDADANIKLFDSVPDVYNKTLDMVAFIVGDNYSPIQSTATKLDVQQRYGRIRPQLKTVDAVEELIPTGASHRKLVVLLERMKKFQSVTKKLQCDGIDLVDVHLLFDSLHACRFAYRQRKLSAQRVTRKSLYLPPRRLHQLVLHTTQEVQMRLVAQLKTPTRMKTMARMNTIRYLVENAPVALLLPTTGALSSGHPTKTKMQLTSLVSSDSCDDLKHVDDDHNPDDVGDLDSGEEPERDNIVVGVVPEEDSEHERGDAVEAQIKEENEDQNSLNAIAEQHFADKFLHSLGGTEKVLAGDVVGKNLNKLREHSTSGWTEPVYPDVFQHPPTPYEPVDETNNYSDL
ncbi:hypothetical protein JG688_00014060, partial [Phytophthora aleatoria]